MPGIGTIVNVIAIIAGGLIGLAVRRGIPERIKSPVNSALGLSVLVIGISGVLSGIFRARPDGILEREDILLLILSLLFGAAVGGLLRIDRGFELAGELARKSFARPGDTAFTAGFVNASILFCTGAMAVVGAMEDGLSSNPETLYAKAILDGVYALFFASSFGAGAILSAAPVLVYQGSITICALALRSLMTDALLAQMSMTGSALVMCIGINMLGLGKEKINVANLLPATFVPVVWQLIQNLIERI